MRVSLLTLCMLGVVALGRQKFDLKRESMQMKKALMLRKKQAARVMQNALDDDGSWDGFSKPNAPREDCMDELSYNYLSGTDCD